MEFLFTLLTQALFFFMFTPLFLVTWGICIALGLRELHKKQWQFPKSILPYLLALFFIEVVLFAAGSAIGIFLSDTYYKMHGIPSGDIPYFLNQAMLLLGLLIASVVVFKEKEWRMTSAAISLPLLWICLVLHLLVGFTIEGHFS